MNSNLLKLNRRNFFEHSVEKLLKLNVSNSGSTILLNNTNNNLKIELPFVEDSVGLFFNFLISEINSSNSIQISCKKNDLGVAEQKLKIKNSIDVQLETEIIIETTETVRRWVGENIRIECNGSFWFLTDSSFNEASNTTSIVNNTNNTVITATGETNITGESNLTFDDTILQVTGNVSFNGSISSNLDVTSVNNNFVNASGDIYSNNSKTSAFFENDWVQVGSDIVGDTSTENLGNKMAISYNASILALGSPRLGRVKIYQWNGSSYAQTSTIQNASSEEYHASDYDLTPDGSIIVVSEPKISNGAFTKNGSFSVYKWSGSAWNSFGNSVFGKRSNERFGYNVKINGDGTIIVASTVIQNIESDAPIENVRVYKISNNRWTQMGSDLSGETGDNFGISVAINGGGNIIAVGAPQYDNTTIGYVKTFKWDGSSWEPMGNKLVGEFNLGFFGIFVDLSFDGLVLATTYPPSIVNPSTVTTKEVKIYNFEDDDWIQKGSSITENAPIPLVGLALSLSADGNTIVIGSPYLNAINKGKVRVYHFYGDWIQLGTDFDNSSGLDNEYFGNSVRLSKDGKTFIANSTNYDPTYLGSVKVYNLQEDLSHVAVSNIINNLTTSTLTADSVLDFSLVNNIYYTVTFSSGNILLSAINATNVGQQGYICFKFNNAGGNVVFDTTAQGNWYVQDANTSNGDKYSFYKYYIFEANNISLISQKDCETR